MLRTPYACRAQPVTLHGSLGREAATGRGVAFAAREVLRAAKLGEVRDNSYVIQVGVEWSLLCVRVLPCVRAGRGRGAGPACAEIVGGVGGAAVWAAGPPGVLCTLGWWP